MIIKTKDHYDCEGTCNLVENYYYDAKRIIDKIKNNKKYNWQMYRYMRENGICNFQIKLLINYPCENEEELKIREYDFIQRYQPKFNFIKSLEQEKKIYNENI